jgi:hypothetical protein
MHRFCLFNFALAGEQIAKISNSNKCAINNIKTTLKNSFQPDYRTIPPLPKNIIKAYERVLNRIRN